MKKNLRLLGVILLLTLLFTNCGGPSACDCLKEYRKNYFIDVQDRYLVERCIKKYGKDIPQEFRGTDEFSRRMIELLENKCKN